VITYPKLVLEVAYIMGLPKWTKEIFDLFIQGESKETKKRFVKCSKGEKECRRYLEEKYGDEFPNVRPDWLINPKTNRKLEIDCYNSKLKIGVEYNGEQHYVYPNFTNQTEEEFKKQVYRDRCKRRICKEQGITLITVPYKIKIKDIGSFIENKLDKIEQRE
jgi:hypothetical protein